MATMIKIITATMVTLGRVATIAKIKSPPNFRLVDFEVIIYWRNAIGNQTYKSLIAELIISK